MLITQPFECLFLLSYGLCYEINTVRVLLLQVSLDQQQHNLQQLCNTGVTRTVGQSSWKCQLLVDTLSQCHKRCV